MLLHHEPDQLDWIGTWLAPLAGPVIDDPSVRITSAGRDGRNSARHRARAQANGVAETWFPRP